ncbi:MAG: RNA-binding protein [Firmicutes bacterium]|nr:RNA-binding protein [Bacillota bacterium]
MQLEPGRLVRSKAGRDAGKLFLVYRVLEDGFVLVIDGDKRPVARPKRKNPRHLEACSAVADGLGARWARGESVKDAEVRAALELLAAKVKEAG